jgi:hypothetical protein
MLKESRVCRCVGADGTLLYRVSFNRPVSYLVFSGKMKMKPSMLSCLYMPCIRTYIPGCDC